MERKRFIQELSTKLNNEALQEQGTTREVHKRAGPHVTEPGEVGEGSGREDKTAGSGDMAGRRVPSTECWMLCRRSTAGKLASIRRGPDVVSEFRHPRPALTHYFEA
ncbi:predicted protein [Histoplasma capsulatum G186AR]|uniref:Uncharacterized protein n=1 Tax=Ajellomyces capsulatus (strain G186AR / H82 / ATCC MYA-2454 / RMSCC 2432) TaxID=447093 RepID=C0NH58_AJECG|nr:uncharacterized protein HCBG_02680 [Histoplasma capsulatum G186AR]EEH09143.1 predicted protein [Histoplasma capsulatum G186AR]